MLLTALAALTLGALPPGGGAIQEGAVAPSPPVISSSPSRSITARPPSVTNGPTRTVCGWERALGSTLQQRVCRKVPLNSSQRERMASEMTREMQGSRWGELPTPRSPGGRPVF